MQLEEYAAYIITFLLDVSALILAVINFVFQHNHDKKFRAWLVEHYFPNCVIGIFDFLIRQREQRIQQAKNGQFYTSDWGIYCAAISLTFTETFSVIKVTPATFFLGVCCLILTGLSVFSMPAQQSESGWWTIGRNSALLLVLDLVIIMPIWRASMVLSNLLPLLVYFAWIVVSRIQFIHLLIRNRTKMLKVLTNDLSRMNLHDRKQIIHKSHQKTIVKMVTAFITIFSCTAGLIGAGLTSRYNSECVISTTKSSDVYDDSNLGELVEIASNEVLKFIDTASSAKSIEIKNQKSLSKPCNLISLLNLGFFWVYVTFVVSLLYEVIKM